MPPCHSYLEPYFGSGAVFFNKEPSPIETINDIDGDVVNLFKCIRQDSNRLSALVTATPYSRREYNDTYGGSKSSDCYEQARRFLVRCWMAAGVRTGMKTGWRNDVQGREAAYALRNWYRLPIWIEECAERLRHAQIECMPATDLIKRFNDPKVLIYADPPYMVSTRMPKQYAYEMTDNDHVELLNVLCEHKGPVILSGYDNELYNDTLNGWNKVSINTTAERGSKRIEKLWMNFEIAIQTRIL
jgi:DNA adenine methylase